MYRKFKLTDPLNTAAWQIVLATVAVSSALAQGTGVAPSNPTPAAPVTPSNGISDNDVALFELSIQRQQAAALLHAELARRNAEKFNVGAGIPPALAPFIEGAYNNNQLPVRADSYRGMLQGVNPASPEQTKYLSNRIKLTDARDSEHYLRELKKHTYETRDSIRRIQGDLAYVNMVAGGGPSFPTLRRFHQITSRYASDDGVYTVMNAPVRRLDAMDFLPDSIIYEALEPNGEIARLPIILASSLTCRTQDAAIRAAWNRVLENFQSQDGPDPQAIMDFGQAVDAFSATSDRVYQVASDHKVCWQRRAPAIHSVRRHTAALETLAQRLYEPEVQEELVTISNRECLAFDGGSMADLMGHLMERRLAPRQGSRAQHQIASLANAVAGKLNGELLDQWATYEEIKSQHRTHGVLGPFEGAGESPLEEAVGNSLTVVPTLASTLN